ncbi:transforming acidic coiled-coil [Lobosporangium transversale]|uniref:Transforming acidic coiled-coil n=1 Tax=Lobosporangium transversale TaxID=64571 RepID=A0A1Y2GYE9_9FUNG|nr:transforming acidic coiled-coil [Lobosporangium transversale]ORZ23793.1 transforming acidic coiled-coil [Lobosporangium transversale]|eukprot:XP_021883607.1 transforming acidic coiled-coil [Lobosporangium transversale]
MKKNVRMDLRIEITNEIREEYERSAEQEAAIYQHEIEELKLALEKEKHEKQQLKNVLDEFESSLADIAVSTAAEIQTIKEENKKLTETNEETEEAFILLKTRYDELKGLNAKHVENEGILRKAIETLKQDFETSDSRYESLKEHADAKLLQASKEMEQARIVYENEIAMLKAQLNRQEMQMRTLEQALEIKNKENEDLILFSEELIAKLS